MNIGLGRRGDYAVRAVFALAGAYGTGRRKAREIAELMTIPERYLPQILAPLVRQGVLTAVAGPDGGYELARPPGKITLLEVVETAEGPVSSDHCVLRGGPCDRAHACAMHDPWRRAQSAFSNQLAATTFEDLRLRDLDRKPPLRRRSK